MLQILLIAQLGAELQNPVAVLPPNQGGKLG